MIKAILFDLDGTLLCMDNDVFIKKYFSLLLTKMAPKGYEPKELTKAIMDATYKVINNDGTKLNRDCFFDNFEKIMNGKLHTDIDNLEKEFDEFYNHEFNEAKIVLDKNEGVKDILDYVRSLNLDIIIATTPVFPKTAVKNRIKWIDEDYDNFKYVTTYENSHYAKPNPKYYLELLNKNHLETSEVIMVGNDMVDDIKPCMELNIKTFYLDNYPLNDINDYAGPRGNFKDLKEYIAKI